MIKYDIRRNFMMSIDPDLKEQLQVFMYAEGLPERSEAEAIRTILRQYLASTPLDGALEVAKQRAFNDMRKWLSKEIFAFFNEKRAQLEAAESAGQQ